MLHVLISISANNQSQSRIKWHRSGSAAQRRKPWERGCVELTPGS